MQLNSIKNDLYRDIVAYGVENPPQTMLRKLVSNFRKPLKVKELENPRLANRFTVGCEVGLIWWYSSAVTNPGNWRVHQHGFLQQDRRHLVKLKVPKQRSCLQLVAGIAKELQIAAQITGQSPEVRWFTGCGHQGYSLTGGVYFGRLGPNRVREIAALDAVYLTLLQAKVFDREKNDKRIDGDQFARRRGMLGDVVSKPFGYKYQSFPSFIESPLQALLTLTLAKLAVMYSTEVSNWLSVDGNPEAKILNLLAKFKGLDEDARLTHWIVAKKGLPKPGGDIKANWQLTHEHPFSIKLQLPLELPVEEVWSTRAVRLCCGLKLEPLELKPWWKQTELPGKAYVSHLSRDVSKALWGLKSAYVDVHENDSDALMFWGFSLSSQRLKQICRTLSCKVKLNPSSEQVVRIPLGLMKDPVRSAKLREILCWKEIGFYEANGKAVPTVPEVKSNVSKVLFK